MTPSGTPIPSARSVTAAESRSERTRSAPAPESPRNPAAVAQEAPSRAASETSGATQATARAVPASAEEDLLLATAEEEF